MNHKELIEALTELCNRISPLDTDPRLEQEGSRVRFNDALLIYKAIHTIQKMEKQNEEIQERMKQQNETIFLLRKDCQPYINERINCILSAIIGTLEELKGEPNQ